LTLCREIRKNEGKIKKLLNRITSDSFRQMEMSLEEGEKKSNSLESKLRKRLLYQSIISIIIGND
jgi:hypothetical protein